jgi:hypothetical protein
MTTPTRRSIGTEPKPSLGKELVAVLWVLTGLIASLAFTWLLFDRMYS